MSGMSSKKKNSTRKLVDVGEINPGEDSLCLGFLDAETESWRLSSKFFPSKVGGYPAWLVLEGLPTAEQLCCHSCQKPLAFLCQLYLPNSAREYAFHRTLFMFVCRDGNCSKSNSSNGLRVFRSQLHRRNKYYSYEPPVEHRLMAHSPGAADYGKLCIICGAAGDKLCSQCKCVSYCSRSHQAIHWGCGHKKECKTLLQQQGSGPSRVSNNRFLFPEAELTLEPVDETDDENSESELTNDEIKQEIKKVMDHDPRVTIDEESFLNASGDNQKCKNKIKHAVADPDGVTELEEMANTDKDETFVVFQEKIHDEPDQVIRYDRRGQPLLCSSHAVKLSSAAKTCPNCKRHRAFEFQVMPQMLNHLQVDSKEASIDWGVLLVYSCFCDTATSYTEELVYKQDFSEL